MNNPPSSDSRHLVVVKALYFLFFAGVGGYFYYLYIYYNQIGLTGAQIGVLSSVGPLVGLLAGPLWGWLSDRFSLTRPLFIFSAAIAMLSAYLLSMTVQFQWILALTILGSLFTGPLSVLLDSTTLVLLGKRGDLYGRQRLFGSMGYIVTSLSFGWLVQIFGMRFIFTGYIVIMGLYLLVSFGLPLQRPKTATSAINKNIFQLLKQRSWGMFAASFLVMAVGAASIIVFLSVYIVKMGGSTELVGIVGALGALIEIPFMFGSSRLIRRFGSRRILFVSYVVYFLRLVLYTVMPVPTWTLLGATTNGLSYSFMQTSSVAYVNEITPPQWKGVSMGAYSALFNLGSMINGVMNGTLLGAIGGGMYAVNAGLLLVAMLLLWLAGSKAGNPETSRVEKPAIAS